MKYVRKPTYDSLRGTEELQRPLVFLMPWPLGSAPSWNQLSDTGNPHISPSPQPQSGAGWMGWSSASPPCWVEKVKWWDDVDLCWFFWVTPNQGKAIKIKAAGMAETISLGKKWWEFSSQLFKKWLWNSPLSVWVVGPWGWTHLHGVWGSTDCHWWMTSSNIFDPGGNS